jgi:uncharacterized protein with GYD domain
VEQRGGTWVGWYMTEGHYDVVTIVESPDDETALAGLLGLAHEGYLRTETLRAFTLEEVEPILQRMP